MSTLSYSRAAELLQYTASTGELLWRVTRGKARAGAPASCSDARGYGVLGIDGRRHYAHRIAVLLMTGAHPPEVVDHINGDRTDNRWCNLRCVSVETNTQNRHVHGKNSQTRMLGVRKFQGKFRAAISLNGVQRHLGTFGSAEEAQAAYLTAKREFHQGCTL